MAAAAREKFLAAEAAASQDSSNRGTPVNPVPSRPTPLKQELKPSNPAGQSISASDATAPVLLKSDSGAKAPQAQQPAVASTAAPKADAPPPQQDEAVTQALASGTWKQVTNKDGRVYYYNPATKATTWDLAKELKKNPPASTSTPASSTTTPAVAASTVASSPKPLLKSESGSSFSGAPKLKSESSTVASPISGLKPNTAPAAVALKPNTPSTGKSTPVALSSTARGGTPLRENTTPNRVHTPPPTVGATPPTSDAPHHQVATASSPQPGGIRDFLNSSLTSPSARPPLGGANAGDSEQLYNASKLQGLLDENHKLQQMIAAGMVRNGSGAVDVPIGADFGGKLDALTRTNHALTIQLKRVSTEHDAMVRALTEANVKVHELQMELDEERAAHATSQQQQQQQRTTPNGRNNKSPGRAGSAAGFGLVNAPGEAGATMAHLRDSNRQLVQQIGELSTLLARALADQSFTTSLMATSSGEGREGSNTREGSGPRYEGFKSILGTTSSSPTGPTLHNPYAAYLNPNEMPQYETLPRGGSRGGSQSYTPQHGRGYTPDHNHGGAAPYHHSVSSPGNHHHQDAYVPLRPPPSSSYMQRSSSLASAAPQQHHQHAVPATARYASSSVGTHQSNHRTESPGAASPSLMYGGFVLRSPGSQRRR